VQSLCTPAGIVLLGRNDVEPSADATQGLGHVSAHGRLLTGDNVFACQGLQTSHGAGTNQQQQLHYYSRLQIYLWSSIMPLSQKPFTGGLQKQT
jgi:hypothetical protein